jgi:cytidyltransferase-like protein
MSRRTTGAARFTAIYPGSFDPVTNGHLDIIRRAAANLPELIVAVVANPNKRPLLSLTQRVELLREVCAGLPNVEVDRFEGLLVDYVRRRNASLIIKGYASCRISNTNFRWRCSTAGCEAEWIRCFCLRAWNTHTYPHRRYARCSRLAVTSLNSCPRQCCER